MSGVCPKCGLPDELCICETIAKESQKIRVKIITKKYGKKATLIEGFDDKKINIKDVAKKLKNKFACGGTYTETTVELQGDHKKKVKEELVKLGFTPGSIED
jgi:translation initiation factor 1